VPASGWDAGTSGTGLGSLPGAMEAAAPDRSADAPLIELGVRMPLRSYLREVWERRQFSYALAENDLRAEHMNSVLGQLWHLLNPAMMIAVYFFIFGVVLDARRGVDNYVTFLVVGVLVFRWSQNTIIGCVQTIGKNLGLIRSIQFPRALVPIAEVLQELLALVPGLALILVVGALDGVEPTWRIAFLPVVLAAGVAFNLGCGLAGARAGAFVTDLQQVLPHFFRIMLYISGVLFSVQATIENQLVRNLFALNPWYCLVAAARWSLLGTAAGERVFLGLTVWAVVALVVGAAYFRRGEHRLGA
jgi:teichoic acid transport system permease protein